MGQKNVRFIFYFKLFIACVCVGGIYYYRDLFGVQTDPELRDRTGRTPLMRAATKNDISEVERLIKNGADVNAQVDDKYGMSVLELAIFEGQPTSISEIVDLLLKAGARTDLQDKQGNTPLHATVNMTDQDEQFEVASKLIEYGAPINIQNFLQGNTPIHTIIEIPRREYAFFMIREYGSMIDMNLENNKHYSIKDEAELNTVEEVLEKYLASDKRLFGEFEPNKKNNLGYTGLMLAIIRNDFQFAKDQVTLRNADVNAQADNMFGNRPLQIACLRRQNVLPYIALLIDNRANPLLTNKAGETPLHMVHYIQDEKERLEVARLLLSNGAYLLIKDNQGNTPIHKAVQHKDIALANFYRDQLGSWVKNNDGLTARDIAEAEYLRVFDR